MLKSISKDNQGETALHYASYYGHYATVEILLKKGAKINTQGNLGETALHHAAFANNVGMIKFLLEAGAKANIKDNNGRKPSSFTDNKEIIDLLNNPPARCLSDVMVSCLSTPTPVFCRK